MSCFVVRGPDAFQGDKFMKNTSLRTVMFLAAFGAATSLMLAAQDIVVAPATPVVPHVVKYSGAMPNAPAAASVVEVKFAMYAAQTGGDPLWSETQQVALDPQSRYAVLLGAKSPDGLPDALFSSGAAKWLGVTLAGAAESPRTLLSANAYALKASDAETLGGHPATDFALIPKDAKSNALSNITQIGGSNGVLVNGLATTTATGPTVALSLDGTYLGTLGAKYFAQIATANTFKGNQTIDGNLTLTGALTVDGTIVSTFLDGIAATLPTLKGNNSFSGTNAFSAPITFASAQTFPGTIKSVTASSPFTATTTSGAVNIALNPTALETDLNPLYARLTVADNFADSIEANQTAGLGYAAVMGFGVNGSAGTFGRSDTGYGIEGASSSGQGVFGYAGTPVAGSEGVLGSTGTELSNIYSEEAGVVYAGVWADTSSSNTSAIPAALFATSDSGYAGGFVNESTDFPALLVDNAGGADGLDASSEGGSAIVGTAEGAGNGVVGNADAPSAGLAGVKGVSATASDTGTAYVIYGAVWGDTGTSSTTVAPAWAIGVLGTADDSHAGVFLNTSTNGWSTLFIANYGTGGTGDSTPELFDTLMAVDKTGTCGVGNGSLSCTGQIKSLVSAGGSRTVETYAMQSPENWMEDFGSGSLANGKAVINLDPAFAETISRDGSYHVFITPNGDSRGLYVSAKSANSFEVRESGGGTSSLSFDYRIVAKRLGYEAQRLTDVTDTLARESARETMARNTGVKKPAAVRKVSPLEQALKTPHRRIVPSPAPRKQIAPKPVAATTHEVASR